MSGESVLLVDDDPGVLEVESTILEEAGFQVARAVNADIALILLREWQGFHVLVTDVVLPGTLDGFALAGMARALRPELAVIYTTGFIEVARLRAPGTTYGNMLIKPYQPDALVDAVRAACASRAVP